jgi:hypothetical protein
VNPVHPVHPEQLSTIPRDRVPVPPSDPVLGIPIAITDYDRALNWIDEMVAAGQPGYVCVSNVHAVMASEEDPELRTALLGSSLNVPDGMPLIWALNLLGHPLRDRVYGPELMARACARAARSGQSFYLYGGRNQGAAHPLPGPADRRRLLTAPPRAHRRRGGFGRRGDQRLRRRRRLGRDRRPQAGEVDGGDARPAAGARPDRRRGRL